MPICAGTPSVGSASTSISIAFSRKTGAERDAQDKALTRGAKTVWILSAVASLALSTAFATFAIGLDRMVLCQVERACVADSKLTGIPFPCREVDFSGGDERGNVVLRPPLLDDTILAPTRKITGIGPVPAVARGAELFRRRMARAHVPQGCGRTGAGTRRDRTCCQFCRCQGPTPARHPRGLPPSVRPPYAHSRCAENPDGRMGADRAGRPSYDVLGISNRGNGPCERQSVSARSRGYCWQGGGLGDPRSWSPGFA
jgi:hypothetical protein